ncbi:integrin alpha-D [Betta splendens]|uniref:Integrin alpha-D n=1 Tax=Betta splendens TaxID=158456 RepID=A0A6P7MCJ1_BETSP|nr:integrin alpha-D [Betta splendens]
MKWQRRICLLACMMALAIPVSLSFNINTKTPHIYEGEQQDFYGYKVLQYASDSRKGLIITAPLKLNESGEISNIKQWFNPKEFSFRNQMIPIRHLGLTIAANSGSQFTVCSPSVAHECYENSYLNSVCYKITENLTQVSVTTPGFQECRNKNVNLVFLFDGSESMTEEEFNKNKDFIKEIIDKLKNSSIKFAAVQFASDPRLVFDFNDYVAGTALDKLQKEPHMRKLTNTHKALTFVLNDILENPAAGATADATKVLVLITDGNPSDTDRRNITGQYEDKNIIRFVIAVKGTKLDKFTSIASKPTKDFGFQIENYKGLTGILGNFQIKIFKMEGTKASRAEDMTSEMAQSGFSAVVYNDTLILGSVGSNTWRGSLEERTGGAETFTQIKDPNMESDSYMGYSISVGRKQNNTLYFTGAPRFNHTGQVVFFTRNDSKWIPAQRLTGDQMGSYFGAELCSVDIDSDGNTDFLLVGAPMFYHPQEKREGQIYVYTLTDEIELRRERIVAASAMGRFGTTISSIADLNGDRLRDVAVGAPLEDENRGAVYIYLGDKQSGIRSTFSQRIAGREIEARLRFFGQSIDGKMDMGVDNLPDIVIGSKGTAVVLRSRPVFNVTAQLSFRPKEIKIDQIECPLKTDTILPMVNLTVCFVTTETTKSKEVMTGSGLNISFALDVDSTRQTHRGFFSRTDRKSRNINSAYRLENQSTCFNYSIYMLKCVDDTLSPISIKLNFTQTDVDKAKAVLNVDSSKLAFVKIPFERLCATSDQCIADLIVDFNFKTPTLLVPDGESEEANFIVVVKLSNDGDRSFNTSITMHYPEGLSFTKMQTAEPEPMIQHCYDQETLLNTTVCGVSLPVFRSNSSITFQLFFRPMMRDATNNHEHLWDDTISMTVAGKSNNANDTNLSSMTKNIPVQFEIKMAVTVKEGIDTYLNFTSEDPKPKRLEIIYRIDNLGWKAFPVNVSLGFTDDLEHNFKLNNYKVLENENQTRCTDTSTFCSSEQHLQVIKCDTFTLRKESWIEIKLSGDVQFKDLKEQAENIAFLKRYTGDGAEVKFQSFIHVDYDTTKYVLNNRKQEEEGLTRKRSNTRCPTKDNSPTVKWTEVRVEFIIPMDRKLIISTGVGLGLLLLILLTIIMFKMGCFKRRQLPMDEEDAESTAMYDTKEEPTEDDKFLDNNEAKGSSSITDS